MIKIAHISLPDDFLSYLDTNWSAGISKPTTFKVINFNRDRLMQGYNTASCCLIHRGTIRFLPLDRGAKSNTWSSSVLLYDDNSNSDSSAKVENYIQEFERLLNTWENLGGGAFITDNDILMHSVDELIFTNTNKFSAVGEFTLFSRQVARSTT